MSQNCICKVCGRFFETDISSEYCPECKKLDEEMYNAVRDYIIAKPRSSIFTVTTELKIPVKVIKRFLREDRLEIVEAENGFLKCEACGKSIHSGYYCRDCKAGNKLRKNSNDSNINENTDGSESLNLGNEKKLKFL